MSVTSFSGVRAGGESLGSSFVGSSLKKSILASSGINSTNSRSVNSSSDSRKNQVSSTTSVTSAEIRSVNTTNNGVSNMPTIKVTAPASTSEAPSTTTSTGILPKAYGKIVLTLENVLLPDEKISPTPSLLDGLDEESETDLRIMGCELITTAGILLKLPQVSKTIPDFRAFRCQNEF